MSVGVIHNPQILYVTSCCSSTATQPAADSGKWSELQYSESIESIVLAMAELRRGFHLTPWRP